MNAFLASSFRAWILPPAILLCLSISCLAGGSISWDEVNAEITKEDKFMASFISQHFDIAPSGGALRVGHDSEGKSMVEGLGIGTRLPPYDFNAKPKGSAGDYTLNLTFEPVSFDDGKTTEWQMTIRKKRK